MASFTGKERDEETGYGYFGARYMDHELMTMWISVDPMSDKYPSVSPYAYCAWNPVRLVDPDGEDVYEITFTGQISKVCESEKDAFYFIDGNGDRIEGLSLEYSNKIVDGEKYLHDEKGNKIFYLEIDNVISAEELFEFISNACIYKSTEFGWAKDQEDNDCTTNLIGFGTHNESHTSANKTLFESGYTIIDFTHNHPDGSMEPSLRDILFARRVQNTFPNASFSIYRIDGTYDQYDGNTPLRVLLPPEVQIIESRIK